MDITTLLLTQAFTLIGIIMLFITAGIARHTRRRTKNCSKITTGTVIDNYKQMNFDKPSQGHFVYYPVIEYTTENGTAMQIRHNTGTRRILYPNGTTVRVRYDEHKPEQIMLDDYERSQKLVMAATAAIGVIFIATGLFAGYLTIA